MSYVWLANLLAAFHAAVILGVVAGAMMALAGRLHRRARWLRAWLVVVGLAGLSEAAWHICLLSAWENALRHQANPTDTFAGSFLARHAGFLPPALVAHGGLVLLCAATAALVFWTLRDRRAGQP